MSEMHHEAREAEARDYRNRQKAKKEAAKAEMKEEYLISNGKVLKKVIAPSGNAYQTYVGKVKECAELIRKHNIKG
jgi:hypothetical protein